MALSKTEEKIYELLKSNELYRGEKGVYTVFPQKLLIEKSGKSESTVQRALRVFEKQGYIIRELDTEIHVMLYYFPKEDFVGRYIHDVLESDTVSTESLEKNDTVSTDGLEKNDRHSTESLENDRHSTDGLEKNEHHSTDGLENDTPSTECLEKNDTVSTESLEKNIPVSTEDLYIR